MMGRRFFLAAALASLLASVGCLRNMCERNGYYPVAASPAPACCCVPCNPCPPGPAAVGYVPPTPASSWNAPAAVPAPGGACVCPPPANH